MTNYAHELFLLSTNLTQFKSKVLITKVFIESINSIFPGHKFSWSEEIDDNEEKCLKVCTRSKTYAYISFSDQPTFTEETFSLLQNAVQWLAIFFEKLEQETLLNNQKEHLNSLVEEKTKDLVYAKEQANSSLQQIEIIQANAPNIIWKWDIDKNENFKNSYISEVADKFLGLPEGSIGNSMPKFFSYISPEYLPLVDDAIKNAIRNPNTLISIEYEVKRADGKLVWFFSSGKVISENEKSTIYGSTIDITEKKQNEHELIKAKESAEKNQKQIELITNNFIKGMIYQVVMLDEEKRKFNYLSKNVKELYGCTAEEAKEDANLIYGKLHPDDIGKLIEKEKEALKSMSLFEAESRVITSDGSIRWAYYISKPRIINGIACWDGIELDITERKQIELELLKSKEKAEESAKILETTLQTAMDGYWVVDLKGRFLNVNDTYCQMSGYNREDLLNMRIRDIEALQSPGEIIKNIHRIKQLGQMRFETKHVRKDGTLYDVEMSIQYQKSNTGQFVCFIKDISAQKRYEKDLIYAKEKAEENREKLLEAQEISHVGSWEYFVDTDIVTWSKELYNIFDHSYELPAPKYAEQALFYTEESFAILDKALQDCVRNEIPYEIELDIITSNGNIKHIISKGNVKKDSNNKIIGSFGTAQDITERKIIERELVNAKEKAEEADRLKTAFLANMSHEIRTPMNGILGFTSLLQEANLSIENQKNYIEIIEKSGNRLLTTVNDIIEISKIESGDINVTKSDVEIIGHLNTLVTFFKPEAKKKNIDIIMQNNIDGNDITITTDKNKLNSILTNLIKNAIKYTDEGTIKVGFKIKNNQVLFSCQDTGIGIPKSRQKAIFNRFEQADIDDKHAHQGSGLGLAIVKSYVELLDGEIWLESEDGQGSIFYVSLPFKQEKKEEKIIPKEIKSSVSGIKNIKVLVVEDDEISSRHLSELLKDKVKNISTALNGIEAIDACKKDSGIDLILMDMKMPVMGGIEATKRIRKFNKDVVIIAQTAYALQGDKEKAIDAGCNDYISKPINKDKLFELINKYF